MYASIALIGPFVSQFDGDDMLDVIILEMTKGNFSFAILIIGIVQAILMILNFFKKG